MDARKGPGLHTHPYPEVFVLHKWWRGQESGNFGVATRFQFRLHQVGTIVGGMLLPPATPAVIAAFVAEAQAAPDELSTIANIEASDATMRVARLRVLGGAMARVPPEATAFAHCTSRIMVNVAAFYASLHRGSE